MHKPTPLDVDTLRADFPILDQRVHGRRLAYLDNAATTQKPLVVLEAIERYYREANSNVHRALHELAARATQGYESVRARVAAFIGAASAEEVVFTRGTTESINLVAHGWGRHHLQAGDAVLLSEMEHHSNLVPWQLLAAERGVELKFIPVLDDGTLDLEAYRRLVREGVRLVAVTQMSNVLGTVNPVRDMAAAAHDAGALVLLDGAQSVPHMPVNVEELGADFLAFGAHKMCGPTGIGALYGRRDVLETMQPFQGGGEMISKVSLTESTWAEVPHKFEAGTPNIAGVFGMGAALDYLDGIGMEAIAAYEQQLTGELIAALEEVRGIRVFGRAPLRGGAVSFEVKGVHPHDVAQFVDREGVAIRAGHHCAQPLMRKLGVTATNRASVYFYNTREDIDQLIGALEKTQGFFGHAT